MDADFSCGLLRAANGLILAFRGAILGCLGDSEPIEARWVFSGSWGRV